MLLFLYLIAQTETILQQTINWLCENVSQGRLGKGISYLSSFEQYFCQIVTLKIVENKHGFVTENLSANTFLLHEIGTSSSSFTLEFICK